MSKNRQPKNAKPHSTSKVPPGMGTAAAPGPFLPDAHPPARSPTLLAVSVVLFVVWFLFLLLAAFSS